MCRLRKVVQTSTALRLDRRDGGYVAVVDGAQLDLTMFRDLASRARVAVRDGRHDEALTDYGLALALAPGSLLIGVGRTGSTSVAGCSSGSGTRSPWSATISP